MDRGMRNRAIEEWRDGETWGMRDGRIEGWRDSEEWRYRAMEGHGGMEERGMEGFGGMEGGLMFLSAEAAPQRDGGAAAEGLGAETRLLL